MQRFLKGINSLCWVKPLTLLFLFVVFLLYPEVVRIRAHLLSNCFYVPPSIDILNGLLHPFEAYIILEIVHNISAFCKEIFVSEW